MRNLFSGRTRRASRCDVAAVGTVRGTLFRTFVTSYRFAVALEMNTRPKPLWYCGSGLPRSMFPASFSALERVFKFPLRYQAPARSVNTSPI